MALRETRWPDFPRDSLVGVWLAIDDLRARLADMAELKETVDQMLLSDKIAAEVAKKLGQQKTRTSQFLDSLFGKIVIGATAFAAVGTFAHTWFN